jgi:NADH-quinone oxidoreductase subunit F
MGAPAPHPKYLVVNADEMEPGTFKDRLLMEGDPHQLIEGVILSAYAVEADVAYIFLRWAYTLAARRIERAIAEAYEAHYLGPHAFGSDYRLELHLHVSAGRYICGEETALLNALEGKRGNPRSKPPFPAVSGLWGKPTVVNNVETICNVPHIVSKGVDWFKKASLTGEGGTKLYGVSGRVKRPGLWELRSARRCARSSTNMPAACGTACGSAACCRAAPRPISSSTITSTCPWTTSRSRRRAAGSAPAR